MPDNRRPAGPRALPFRDHGQSPPTRNAGEPLLQVDSVSKAFGGNKALTRVSLQVAAGEAVGLVGPNGSGKTTLINVISGVNRPDDGSVRLRGLDVTGLASHRLCHLGLNRTFQIPRPLGDLRVADNLAVVRRRRHPVFDADPLEFVGLTHVAHRLATSLTSGQQKLLDLARALAAGPDVLLVDEIGAGLGPEDLEHVAGLLRQLRQAGLGLLVVEHLMGFLEQVVDSVVVLNAGQPIFRGPLRAAVADQQVIDVFLGE